MGDLKIFQKAVREIDYSKDLTKFLSEHPEINISTDKNGRIYCIQFPKDSAHTFVLFNTNVVFCIQYTYKGILWTFERDRKSVV